MVRINSMTGIESAAVGIELKKYLMSKFSRIMDEYGLSDICDVFSVIVLEIMEADYFGDKYFEFSEVMLFDNLKYIHTVWAASDGYSEDIYIPYSESVKTAIEGRCL
ncbi:MAG: hypothetical protein J6M07_08155 [Ruminococcus sp.]|nr:hypothetical protein [Ruminococcus sp.]